MASSIPAGGSGGGRGNPVNVQATRVTADISVGHHQPTNMPGTVSGQQTARTAGAGDPQSAAAAARGSVDIQQQQLQQTGVGGGRLELHQLPGRIDEGVLYGGPDTMTFQQEGKFGLNLRKLLKVLQNNSDFKGFTGFIIHRFLFFYSLLLNQVLSKCMIKVISEQLLYIFLYILILVERIL